METEGTQPEPGVQDDGFVCSTDFFYRKNADTTVCLKDGEKLKFNKSALISCAQSTILYEIFFGDLKDPEETNIPDLDYASFKLFLDCIMGYEPFTFDNAFQIFPIVWKYQIQNFIDKCIEALKAKEMTPKISKVLNMAAYFDCKKLEKQIFDVIFLDYNAYRFLEMEECCSLLKPESMKIILSKLKMDSYLVGVVTKWGCNYMQNNPDDGVQTLKSFFDKNDLLQFFKLKLFETTGAISEFCRSEVTQNFFSTVEILSHITDSKTLIHGKSEWKKVGENTSIFEVITFPACHKSEGSLKSYTTSVRIERNVAIIYDNVGKNQKIINGRVEVVGQTSGISKLFSVEKEIDFLNDGKLDSTSIFSWSDESTSLYPYSRMNLKLARCAIKIKWTFLRKCRVLLTSRPSDEFNNCGMYFTKNVSATF